MHKTFKIKSITRNHQTLYILRKKFIEYVQLYKSFQKGNLAKTNRSEAKLGKKSKKKFLNLLIYQLDLSTHFQNSV